MPAQIAIRIAKTMALTQWVRLGAGGAKFLALPLQEHLMVGAGRLGLGGSDDGFAILFNQSGFDREPCFCCSAIEGHGANLTFYRRYDIFEMYRRDCGNRYAGGESR